MGHHPSQGMPAGPAAATGLAACAASAILFLPAFALWSARDLPAVLMLLSLPVLTGFAAWTVARRAIRDALRPAAVRLDRLAEPDCPAGPTVLRGGELQELAQALERCRAAQARHRRATKVHAAVARLASAAVGRLAEGDASARISVDLPQPYAPLREHFNAAAEAMEQARTETRGPAERLRENAREIGEAAAQLARRAGKLAERLEADVNALETGEDDADDALRRLLHTLDGARVAAGRNAEAAERFAGLGLVVAREAERLAGIGEGPEDERDDPPLGKASADIRHLPAATVPLSIGATALKFES